PHRDAEVDLRLLGDLTSCPEHPDQQRCGQVPRDRQHGAHAEGQPHAVDADGDGIRLVSGAEPPCDRRRRRVREEHHEADDRLQHGAGQPESRQRRDAEVADQRRVDDEEERLCHERPEGRHRETQDLAVQGVGGGHRTSLRPPAADPAPALDAGVRRGPPILDGMTDAPRSGLALDDLSAAIRPQDDLFRYVNGNWLERTEIPDDTARWGAVHVIAEQAEKDVRAIVEECQDAETGTEARKIGDLYTSFMDTDRVADLGAAPLADQLARVEAIASIPQLLRTVGELEREGAGGIVTLY